MVGTFSPRLKQKDPTEPEIEDTLAELAQLTASAGGRVFDTLACRLDRINPASFINKGKVEEIAALIKEQQIELVIFDDELSPRQSRNLEAEFGVRTIDRRALILDIFARRAQTREGQLQVELAQMMYLLPRLTRMWTHLERQRGGIGLKGPGETQLEIDQRLVRERMRKLKKEIERVQNTRHLQREKRKRTPVPQVVLVGYTNSGKSTLFNRLTQSEVLAANQLFATLDPTTRKISLNDDRDVLITDSVGFIRKLPHELVEAFKATLEEVQNADLLLHIIDASDPLWESHKRATEKVLEELDCLSKPILEVYNKLDALKGHEFRIAQSSRRVFISALEGLNIPQLLGRIHEALSGDIRRVKLLLPQGRGDLLAVVHREGKIIEEDYRAEFVAMTVDLPVKRVEQWKKLGFIVSDSVLSSYQ